MAAHHFLETTALFCESNVCKGEQQPSARYARKSYLARAAMAML